MRIVVNGNTHELPGPVTLAEALDALDYRQASVATAVNGSFVPADHRPVIVLAEGDALEILAPMQGG